MLMIYNTIMVRNAIMICCDISYTECTLCWLLIGLWTKDEKKLLHINKGELHATPHSWLG